MDHERLQQAVQTFATMWHDSEKMKNHIAEHQRRMQRAQILLQPERIPHLTEEELRELFLDTDAFSFWQNAEGEFQRRLAKTSLADFREVLHTLIQRAEVGLTPEDLAAVLRVYGLGVLLITELLCYRFPDRYWTFSPNVTNKALHLLGVDTNQLKRSLPRGQRNDAHLYFALKPVMDEVVASLREAGIPEADYNTADIFLWHLLEDIHPNRLTIQDLVQLLHHDQPTPETREQAFRFLGFLQEQVMARLGSITSRIGPQKPSAGSRHFAQLTIPVILALIPGKKNRRAKRDLNLEVYVLPGRLWWGVYVWTFQEMAQRLQDIFADLGLVREGERAQVGKGALELPDTVWGGGSYFALGKDLTPEEVSTFASVDALANHLAEEITAYYHRIIPLAEAIRQRVIVPPDPDAIDARQVAKPPSLRGPALARALRQVFRQQGLHFTPWQIATFYTALQTKGFIILSGISGTGKTKLARQFAAALPQPQHVEEETTTDLVAVTVQPYMRKYGRLIIPKRATPFFTPPAPGEAQEITVHFGAQRETCRFVHAAYGDSDYLSLLLRGEARRWFTATLQPEDTLYLDFETDAEGNLRGLRLLPEAELQRQKPPRRGRNWLFVPVRPDWRDGKSLLGYYNPLTNTYHWTPFLRFVLQAVHSYRRRDGLAWFVILDEMNLARVEYYFGDLLSVLESGRDEEGWSREPLRFTYPDDAEGDRPPREIFLPPNLYILGTINVDETTHSLSPKVLDRAFTLELNEADLEAYLTPWEDTETVAFDSQAVLRNFSFEGRFVHLDKRAIAAFVAGHPEIRAQLHPLNQALQPYDLHFGYRVFDEIIAFLLSAEHNGLYEELGGLPAALDAAVLMKVLPKFHGGRSKLEAPLRAVLAWCVDPDQPATQRVAAALDDALRGNDDPGIALSQALTDLAPRMPQTAAKVRRMLGHLYTTGFAAF